MMRSLDASMHGSQRCSDLPDYFGEVVRSELLIVGRVWSIEALVRQRRRPVVFTRAGGSGQRRFARSCSEGKRDAMTDHAADKTIFQPIGGRVTATADLGRVRFGSGASR